MMTRALVTIRAHRGISSLVRSVAHVPGIGWALRRLAQGVVPRGERVWAQVADGPGRGLWLKLDPYREVGYLRGRPEPGVLEVLQEHLQEGDCFFDVGAHIGFYALIAARLVGRQGRVVTFEPDAANLSLLQDNARRNDLAQIVVSPAAVWRRSGRLVFRTPDVGDPHTSTRRGTVTDDASCASANPTRVVAAVSLDDYCRSSVAPTLIKVDVEGVEAEVIEGAEVLLRTARPTLIIEVHHQEAASSLERRLKEHKYDLRWLPTSFSCPFPRHLLALPSGAEKV